MYETVMELWIFLLLMCTVVEYGAGDGIPCPVQASNCQCSFSDDDNAAKETSAESRAQTMAIAAGALSPLVVAGIGLGIWKLVTREKDAKKCDDLWPSPRTETPDYENHRGSNDTVSMLNTDDEISFTNSRPGSTTNLVPTDDDSESRNKPHPSHNWGSDSPYLGSQTKRNSKPIVQTMNF